MKYIICWTADLKSNELWSSQLWGQFLQLRVEAWKIQDFNGVWIRDLAIPVRRSNQLGYEATEVRSWSFVLSNKPVRHEWWSDIWNTSYASYTSYTPLKSWIFQASIRNCKNCVHNCDWSILAHLIKLLSQVEILLRS